MSKRITKLIKIHISTFVFVVNMKRFLCKRKTNLFKRASCGALEFKLGFKCGFSFGFVLVFGPKEELSTRSMFKL